MPKNLPFSENEIDGSLADRFRRVVSYQADHIAISADDTSFTFAEIDSTSDHIAHAILQQAPSHSGPIAILLPQSAQVIAAILGCLKAGRSFVVLSPLFPESRLRTMWADAQSPLMLTSGQHWEQAVAVASSMERCIDIESLDAADEPLVPTHVVGANELAAVFFTSGTTDGPKGVMWSHQLVLHSARQEQMLYGITPQDHVAVLNSFAFAAGMMRGFAALLNGATLCLVDDPVTSEIELIPWLKENAITVIGLSTGLLNIVIDKLIRQPVTNEPAFPDLRLVILGGEPIHRKDVERFRRYLGPNVGLRYRLAGTETMLMREFVIDGNTIYPGDNVPVGHAVPDKEIVLLNDEHQSVELGETGEIAVRSRYLATGYWRQPLSTASKFLDDPAADGMHIYLTGDMGRLTPEGLLYHLGRKSNMLKIRGYRVEPETIEQALLAHPAVYECAVMGLTNRSGGIQLVAYQATLKQPLPTVSELREFLAQTLPSYMIPARFVFIEQLPRNANHKINRQALPPLGAARPDLDTPYVAPQTELEQQIADIWAGQLELDGVGMNDNFFELGGDSLSALRMVLEVEESTGRAVPTEFFRTPTVAQLERLISGEVAPAAAMPVDSHQHKSPQLTGRLPRLSGQRLRQQIVRTGPLWRGHTLPYGLGVRLQRTWLALPGVRERLFSREIQVLRRWSELVGEQHPEAAIQQSLLQNTWTGWRHQALGVPLGSSPWVTIKGDPILWQPQSGGAGVIFLFLHTRLSKIFICSLEAGGHDLVLISSQTSGWETRIQDHAAQVQRADQALQRGKTVIIGGDGGHGRQGVLIPFYSGQRLFRQGAAELAAHTGARLVPVFCTITPDGRVKYEVCSPLVAEGNAAETQVEALTRTYAELVVERWPQVYSSMNWRNLEKWLRRLAEGRI